MTALQDWLSAGPLTPNSLKTVVLDAWRGLTSDEAGPTDEPQLMGRGLERC
ncbi:hypothetical protein [Mycolicibacterium hippocampi]|uniref:hypothetical protein n=1 Tax=Mycobacteriaceae TaxID=1762 RepID=UPI0015B55862|nr:hypothetical protein [Mycolicibacterium hippocampi]